MKLKKDLDSELLERLLFKDPEALKQLVSSYSRLLFQIAVRITGDQKASEKILCDVFRELWDKPNHFTQSEDTFLSSYLIKRCKIKCVQFEETYINSLLSKKSKNYIAACRSI
ncbi:RNA polymerase sigma factor [Fictibacillus halophilus]|uniref:RNA polymerase sigma factor n=1 Tax=Fictibacillus halophilus TaxID=1610490 RepID=UPI001CF9F743|nr:sigma factor [Fictibacillus halophilus]